MDKYTVDLDQVLNDFEYSELTDHHDFDSVRPSKHQNTQNSSSNYLQNNFKNTNVKHSINNVFHSLNEYLNTEIAPKVANNRRESLNEGPSLVEKPPEDENVLVCEEEPEISAIQRENQEKAEEHPAEVALVENEAQDEETDDSEPYTSIESVTNDDEPLPEAEIVIKPKCENSIAVEEVKIKEIGFDDFDIDESELNKYLDDLEDEFESPSHQEDLDNERNEEIKLLGDETEPIPPNQLEEDDKIEVTHEIPKIIEQSNKDEETSTNAITNNNRPNNLELLDHEEGDDPTPTKGVIDLVGNPGSTPYNNVYVNKELPKVDTSDTEGSTSASPTFSDLSVETTSSMTPSTDTINDNDNNTQQNDSETKEVSEEANESGDDVTAAVPNDLQEGGEGGGDESEVVTPETVNQQAEQERLDKLGKEAPLWIPDACANECLHCDTKFTVIKRRHHCRACGYVLCSKCCNLRHRLDYLEDVARVCTRCYDVLSTRDANASSDSELNSPSITATQQQPNPNRPLEYCSTVPPHQQVTANATPPSVMVPVGVLKRKGSNKARSNKSVMFCDGIRPGSDLTNLDSDFGYREVKPVKKLDEITHSNNQPQRSYPIIDTDTRSYIPSGEALPPTVTVHKSEMSFTECSNTEGVVEMLRNETLTFAIQLNFLVHVRIINMDCCINKSAWCFSTEGLINVGQDEIVIILEVLDDEQTLPKDIFLHLNNIYTDAVKGTSVKEMGLSLHNSSNFLGSKNHAGFVFIRTSFQCIQNIIKPSEPYLVGILIHRWETPWAKLFPLRLILRLGAEYRYYPSPIISNRYRDSVFVEIGHTIINLLADFRNFSYTLPQIRGLTIHMEDKNTTVTIPSNRYDQVMKSMNNSSDHILAFAGNFSNQADSHLVCIQDTQSNENAYSTHAINIHNKPRKVTGASFIVFNGALKSSSGLTAKSSIVEDGLMIQIPPEHMVQIRDKLRNMKDHIIQCGCVNATSDETVNIVWGEPDVNFNINVCSPIDDQSMGGVPSIRVHNGRDYVCTSGNRIIRWTEVFIIQNGDEIGRNQDPVDISKVSESIAKATCAALLKYLDLLVSNSFYKIGIRVNLHVENVSYSAGSNAMKLPPIYMKSLDNELIPVLHRITSNNFSENAIILELIFRILNK